MKNRIIIAMVFFLFIGCNPDKLNSQTSANSLPQIQLNDSKYYGERWFEIGAYGKVLAFSKIAKPGRISVFIMSTDWCGPCRKLKQDLKTAKIDKTHVDFYYVNMSQGHTYDQLKKTVAYRYWRIYERIEEWPTVTVVSPVTNIIKRYSTASLAREANNSGETSYDRTIALITRLNNLIETDDFSENVVLTDIRSEQLNDHDVKSEQGVTFRTIRKGETISKIAREYKREGYNINYKDIMRWNDIEEKDTSNIKPGTKLKIYLE